MKRILSIILALTLVFALAACGGSGTPAKTDAPGGATDPGKAPEPTGEFVIGSSQPLSGTNAAIGDDQVKGAQLAIKQINDRGGLNGAKVSMKYYDDQGIPEEAVKIASKLVEVDRVDVVMGSLISSNMLATGKYFNDNKIMSLGTGLSPTWMEQGWEYVWRACVNNGRTMPVLAQKVYDMGVRSVAVLHGQDDANMSAFKSFKEKAEELGITITSENTYVEGDSDFSGQIASMVNSKADAMMMSSHGSAQGAFIKQLRAFGYEGLALVKEPYATDAIEMSGKASDNVAFIYPYVTYAQPEDCDDPDIRQFLEDFVKEFGRMPTHDCAYRGYDAINTIAAAAEKAKSNKSEDMNKALGEINSLKALVGTLDFTQGDREGLHGDISGFIVLDTKYVDLDSWIKDGGYDKLPK